MANCFNLQFATVITVMGCVCFEPPYSAPWQRWGFLHVSWITRAKWRHTDLRWLWPTAGPVQAHICPTDITAIQMGTLILLMVTSTLISALPITLLIAPASTAIKVTLFCTQDSEKLEVFVFFLLQICIYGERCIYILNPSLFWMSIDLLIIAHYHKGIMSLM